MAVAALLQVLEAQARAEAGELRARAQAEAERILARAEADIERRRSLHLERLRREGRTRIARETGEVARALRQSVLQARAEVVERVLGAARQRLGRMPVDEYADRLGPMLAEALPYFDAGDVVVECVPAAAAILGSVAVEVSPSAEAGLLVRSRDRRVVVDQTLVGRLVGRQDALALMVVARLGPPVT
jgi:vacuolar-type H+-ATPase subunit E/Vma4